MAILMMLRHKMLLQMAALILGLLLISIASLWGINAMTQDFGVALRGYEQLRRVYEVGSQIRQAQQYLTLDRPDPLRAREELRGALLCLQPRRGAPAAGPDSEIEQALQPPIEQFLQALGAAIQGHYSAEDYGALSSELSSLLSTARKLDADIRARIRQKEQAADAKRRATILLMALLAGGVTLVTVLLGVFHYRSVMRPLNRLAGGVRTLAAGRFNQRLDPRGPGEFVALARDFNSMAAQLDELYHELEAKVAAKSRQLVRSERLASVGYLAAGVAHEINNPLGIITGYAELSIKELQKTQSADDPTLGALRVICEEAYRCKDITQKLLSLATPGAEARRPVSLAAIARDVVSMLTGLKQYRDKQLVIEHDDPDACIVLASEGEMKQVLLNLVLNALDAVASATGRVRVEVRQRDGQVELSVADNGRGMSPQTLERIFEPFFTDKRGARQPGTGLGLSITHAIVESHGGQILAQSPGANQGATFTVTLPLHRAQ